MLQVANSYYRHGQQAVLVATAIAEREQRFAPIIVDDPEILAATKALNGSYIGLDTNRNSTNWCVLVP